MIIRLDLQDTSCIPTGMQVSQPWWQLSCPKRQGTKLSFCHHSRRCSAVREEPLLHAETEKRLSKSSAPSFFQTSTAQFCNSPTPFKGSWLNGCREAVSLWDSSCCWRLCRLQDAAAVQLQVAAWLVVACHLTLEEPQSCIIILLVFRLSTINRENSLFLPSLHLFFMYLYAAILPRPRLHFLKLNYFSFSLIAQHITFKWIECSWNDLD